MTMCDIMRYSKNELTYVILTSWVEVSFDCSLNKLNFILMYCIMFIKIKVCLNYINNTFLHLNRIIKLNSYAVHFLYYL